MYTQRGRSLWDRTDRKAHPGGLNELSSNALMIVEVSHVWSGFLALGEKKERGGKGKESDQRDQTKFVPGVYSKMNKCLIISYL